MDIQVEVKLVETTIKGLNTCYKPVEVLNYCKNCSNFGQNYSCPEFDFQVEDYIGAYSYVTLVMTTIKTSSFEGSKNQLASKTFNSRVLENYRRDYPMSTISWEEQFSMFVFNVVKDEVTQRLLTLENEMDNALSIPPGSCTHCSPCRKSQGQPCVLAKSLRYSLEALGYSVSDIYKKYFDKSLHWVEEGLPQSFDTCSAIFSRQRLDLKRVEEALKDLSVTI